jgi:hypothetical protein
MVLLQELHIVSKSIRCLTIFKAFDRSFIVKLKVYRTFKVYKEMDINGAVSKLLIETSSWH